MMAAKIPPRNYNTFLYSLTSYLILKVSVLQCSTYIRIIVIKSIPKYVKQSLNKTKCRKLEFLITVSDLYKRGITSIWDSLRF